MDEVLLVQLKPAGLAHLEVLLQQVHAQIFAEMEKLCHLVQLQPTVMMEAQLMEMDAVLLAQLNPSGLVLEEIQVQLVLVLIFEEMGLL